MNFSFLKEKGNKYLIYILLGVLVLVVIFPTGSQENQTEQQEVTVTQDELETRLERVLSSMEGVGNVEVMITTENSEPSLFSEDETGTVCGVVVVAQGAGNATVDTQITDAVKALFSIEAHKISIVKMKSQEGSQ